MELGYGLLQLQGSTSERPFRHANWKVNESKHGNRLSTIHPARDVGSHELSILATTARPLVAPCDAADVVAVSLSTAYTYTVMV